MTCHVLALKPYDVVCSKHPQGGGECLIARWKKEVTLSPSGHWLAPDKPFSALDSALEVVPPISYAVWMWQRCHRMLESSERLQRLCDAPRCVRPEHHMAVWNENTPARASECAPSGETVLHVAPVSQCTIGYNTYPVPDGPHTSGTLPDKAKTILEEAQSLIFGDRNRHYGHPRDNFLMIGKLWSALLGIEVEPRMVARMMAAMKLARDVNLPQRDNLVDGAGYLGCAERLLEPVEPAEEGK